MNIQYPYGLVADLHFHAWNAFSKTDADGVNSRLNYLLSDLKRCANEVRAEGGNAIVLAGDVFHVRGSVSPSVLNPVLDAVKDIISMGVRVIALAGNHDLEGKTADRLGSAITALEGVGVRVVEKADVLRFANGNGVLLVSWIENIAELKQKLESVSPADRKGVDCIIHAPIDGVVEGLPAHGLTDVYLASLGYDRVFAGHYHNHKDFGNGVYSIGALAHHTWSDVDTKAGFLLVGEKEVKYRSSHSPKFIQIDETTDMEELQFIVDGNYTRAKIGNVTAIEVEQMRELLKNSGAIGSVIHAIKSTVEAREGGAVEASKSMTMHESIADFIAKESIPDAAEVLRKCLSILSEVESV